MLSRDFARMESPQAFTLDLILSPLREADFIVKRLNQNDVLSLLVHNASKRRINDFLVIEGRNCLNGTDMGNCGP